MANEYEIGKDIAELRQQIIELGHELYAIKQALTPEPKKKNESNEDRQ